jgi:hypothetical protein
MTRNELRQLWVENASPINANGGAWEEPTDDYFFVDWSTVGVDAGERFQIYFDENRRVKSWTQIGWWE